MGKRTAPFDPFTEEASPEAVKRQDLLTKGEAVTAWFDGKSGTIYIHNMRALETVDPGGFDAGNVENMDGMFWKCRLPESLTLTGPNTGAVTNMANLFSGCEAFKELKPDGLQTGAETDMSWMFMGSGLQRMDLSGLGLAALTQTEGMFNHCENLTELITDKEQIREAYESRKELSQGPAIEGTPPGRRKSPALIHPRRWDASSFRREG